MKLIIESWKKYLAEVCEPGVKFNTDTGEPCPPAGAEKEKVAAPAGVSMPGTEDFDIVKCAGDPECTEAFHQAWNHFMKEEFTSALSSLPAEVQRILFWVAKPLFLDGQPVNVTPESRLPALNAIGKLKPSKGASESPAAAPETGGDAKGKRKEAVEKLKAGLQKILKNPDIPQEDKEEARREFEEEIRELSA